MKNDLTCGVVRDLLPSYVEGLLGEETQKAVENHLDGCPDCTARKDAMNAQAEEAKETEREVDYLKQVKRANRKRVIVSVIATAAGLLAALALKIFVIGTPLQAQSVAVMNTRHTDDVLYVSLMSVDSGTAFHGWKVEVEDGVASIYARSVLVSPLFHDGGGTIGVSLGQVREVWLGGISGRLLWAEGLEINQRTIDLLNAKTPYCGDASALGRIVDLLRIEQTMGDCVTSLHTSNEPYIWSLEFKEPLGEEKQRLLMAYACQMLALVENLDEVAFTYELEDPLSGLTFNYNKNKFEQASETSVQSRSVTAERAALILAGLTETYNNQNGTDWPIHESIKEYAESPLEYQRMAVLLEKRFHDYQYSYYSRRS